jgi:pseudaminic acid synthase
MEINIQNRAIGNKKPPFIIAEISANHGGDIEIAKKTIQSAKDSGADAVKLQTYTPDTMTIDCDNPDFLINEGLWKGRNLYELYQEAYTPYEWHPELFSFCKEIGIICFSTPFDESAIDLLEDLNTPAYKVASFELTDHLLLKNIAETKKPVIMSSGMATLEEIAEAFEILTTHGTKEIAILHCVSGYPTEVKYANLQTIIDLKNQFNCIIGLSDHTLSNSAAIASISLGAAIVEKHFILDKNLGGPDSVFSIEPEQFKRLKNSTTEAWESLGSINYDLKGEEVSMVKFRRSLYVVKDMLKGEAFNSSNLRRIRPGKGIEPKYFESILGKKALRDINYGTALNWEMVGE